MTPMPPGWGFWNNIYKAYAESRIVPVSPERASRLWHEAFCLAWREIGAWYAFDTRTDLI